MSKILTLAALVIALALFGAPLAQAQDSPNDFSNESQFAPQSSIPSDPKAALTVCPGTEVDLSFGAAGDAFIFTLTPTANGTVKVWTADRFAFGPDIWRAALHQIKPNGPGKSKSGDGSVDVFTGKLSLGVKVGRTYHVIVSPDDVPAGFGAIMTVCISGPVSIVGPLAE